MYHNIEPQPVSLTIKQLLTADEYIIPLYQRNYAWSDVEIMQLLQDIRDKARQPAQGHYYIGTFVTDLRENGKFELVDGQQRHTTLTLIHAVLNKGGQAARPNLYFDARHDVESVVALLFRDFTAAKNTRKEDISVNSIITAVQLIEDFIESLGKDREQFSYYFYNRVMAFRVAVPKDTEINHYFEVMNNRGEQLEKHEVLKAAFMDQLKASGRHEQFGFLWEACSQMDCHVQSRFSLPKAKIIFGGGLDQVPTDIMSKDIALSHVSEGDDTIMGILSMHKLADFPPRRQPGSSNRFTSIIDFPGFLLLVLNLQGREVPLDDKRLLHSFGYTKGEEGYSLPDGNMFMNNLFYYRTVFDKLLIKREESDDRWAWDLSRAKNSDDTLYYVNTFGKEESDDNEGVLARLIKLQSMLHVSFPANNYKRWLLKTMQAIKENSSIAPEQLEEKLRSFISEQCAQITLHQFSAGTHTPRFLFNLLDYILWENRNHFKLSREGKQAFARFKFTVNNSVEHMLPQSCIDEIKTDRPKENILNDFGNLCLISRGANSKYNNFNFKAKKQQFLDHPATESLKQVLMFEYKDWNTPEILEHGAAMKKYLRDLIPGADDSL